MKFKQPEYRDRRKKTKFLLLPKRIGNETRWLVRASYWQRYNKIYPQNKKWVDISWD